MRASRAIAGVILALMLAGCGGSTEPPRSTAPELDSPNLPVAGSESAADDLLDSVVPLIVWVGGHADGASPFYVHRGEPDTPRSGPLVRVPLAIRSEAHEPIVLQVPPVLTFGVAADGLEVQGDIDAERIVVPPGGEHDVLLVVKRPQAPALGVWEGDVLIPFRWSASRGEPLHIATVSFKIEIFDDARWVTIEAFCREARRLFGAAPERPIEKSLSEDLAELESASEVLAEADRAPLVAAITDLQGVLEDARNGRAHGGWSTGEVVGVASRLCGGDGLVGFVVQS